MDSEPECRLHHLAVGSADVERLAAFYQQFFGLHEVARHLDAGGALRAIWLELGGAILMLERTRAEAAHVEGISAGPFLMAFRVSPAARPELERRLEAAGHAIESRTAFTSYTRDVDGNRVALSHYPLRGLPATNDTTSR